jgi:prephenate dehydrogenase
MKILIIGGLGKFGQFYAKLFKENGFVVGITDVDGIAAKNFCLDNDFIFSDNVKDFDTIILSVPNSVAPKLVKEIIPRMKKDSLLMDFCSVKTFVVEEEKKFVDKEIELVSIHPMHGPRVNSINGYPIIFIPIKCGKKCDIIKKFFEKEEGGIIESSVEEHDKILSIVQGLTHYSQFVSASILRELEVDLKKTIKFSSPNYSLFISLLSRVVLQNPELYCQIQLENPYNGNVRKIFTKNAKLLENICEKKDYNLLKKEILIDAQSFKNAELMLIESDKAINAMKYVVNTLKDHVGEMFLVENILTNKYHYGKISSVNNDELILLEGKKEVIIATSKIRLTTKQEMKEWKEQNLQKKYLDFSFIVPKECDNKIVKQAFSTIYAVNFEIVDEYVGNLENCKSLTLRANFFIDNDSEEISLKIIDIINGLGFKRR